jgi:precorrin-4 methylase
MNMLFGYKTYIVAGVTVIGAVAAYLVGDATLQDTIQLVITAVLGATLRNGIK